jgi:hypothetical protein
VEGAREAKVGAAGRCSAVEPGSRTVAAGNLSVNPTPDSHAQSVGIRDSKTERGAAVDGNCGSTERFGDGRGLPVPFLRCRESRWEMAIHVSAAKNKHGHRERRSNKKYAVLSAPSNEYGHSRWPLVVDILAPSLPYRWYRLPRYEARPTLNEGFAIANYKTIPPCVMQLRNRSITVSAIAITVGPLRCAMRHLNLRTAPHSRA